VAAANWPQSEAAMKTLVFTAALVTLLCLQSSYAVTAAAKELYQVRYGGSGTVLLFVSSQCPCTDQHRIMINNMVREYADRGIEFCCVFSNAGETNERINKFYRGIGWTMPYVKDPEAKLAELYGVAQTPTAVLLGRLRNPLYRGPIDDSNKNQGFVEHAYLRDQTDRLLNHDELALLEVAPVGCWIVKAGSCCKKK
jgi:hypothetical protein